MVKGKKKIDKSAHLYRLPNRHRTERDLIYWGKVASLATIRFIRDKGNVVALSRSNWNLRGFILLSFFFAGMASLMDQVLWMRQLGLIFGTTMQSVSTVLAIFMAGLALGSFLFGRMADKTKSPLRLFALLQIGIGLYVMLTPLIFKGLNAVQISVYASLPVGSAGITILRILFAFLVLIIPTTLMGGTLPVIAKYFVRKQDELGGGLGNLYFINTLGAVLGAFLAGFFLIPYIGVLAATLLAASIDLSIGVVFYLLCRYKLKARAMDENEPLPVVEEVAAADPALLAKKQVRRLEREQRKQEKLRPEVYSRAIKIVVFAGFAFGGLAALGLEVSWTRVLSMILGSSIYAFSLMLTAFLLGIALGSAIVSKFVDRLRHLWVYFFVVQVLLALAVLVLNPILGELPLVFVKVFANLETNFWALQLVQFLLLLLIMLVPTLLMGAAFPIAVRIYSDDMEHMGGSVGRLYAGNTLGSMVGPLITGFIIIPLIGIQWSVSLVSIIYLIIAGAVFVVGFKDRLAAVGTRFIDGYKQHLWQPHVSRAWGFVAQNTRVRRIARGIALLPLVIVWPLFNPARAAKALASASFGLTMVILPVLLVISILIPALGAWDKKILNSGVFLYSSKHDKAAGNFSERLRDNGQLKYYNEGLLATVAVYDEEDGDRVLTVDGKVDATSFGDLPTELISGHLPMILHNDPKEVLLVGLGSGITLGAVELYPSLVTVEAVEIEDAVIEAASYFKEANGDALNNEKLTIIQADARNYVLAQSNTGKEYDIITAEPSNPWMAGNSILFTREQFELYKKVLSDDGIICQWIHYYSMSLDDVKTVLGTFTDVFPDSTLWRTGGDLLLIGTKSEQSIDFTALNARLQQPDVSGDLARMDVNDIYDLLGRFVMGPAALADFSDGAPMHTDNHPILQFSAPKSLHSDTSLMNNAKSLQQSAQKIEDIASLLINIDDVNFSQEIQKQRGFYIHFTDATVYSQLGLLSGREGDYYAQIEYINTAIAAQEAILSTGANDAYAYRRLGGISLARGKDENKISFVEQAIPYLEQSVALNPTVVTTWIDLGEAYFIMGVANSSTDNYLAAIEAFSRALDLVEDNAFLYNLRGQANQYLGDWDAAIEDFDMAIRLSPAFTEVWTSRALAYLNLVERSESDDEKAAAYVKALSDANRALQLDIRQSMAYHVRGRVYYEMGEQTGNTRYYDLAIAEQGKAISMSPDLKSAYLYLGKAYVALGGRLDYTAAMDLFNKAILVDEYYGEAFYEFGLFHLEKSVLLTEYFPEAGIDWIQSAIQKFVSAYNIDPASELSQDVVDTINGMFDWNNVPLNNLDHILQIYADFANADVTQKVPAAIDVMIDWDNITATDRDALDKIIDYLLGTDVGDKAQDAINELDAAS